VGCFTLLLGSEYGLLAHRSLGRGTWTQVPARRVSPVVKATVSGARREKKEGHRRPTSIYKNPHAPPSTTLHVLDRELHAGADVEGLEDPLSSVQGEGGRSLAVVDNPSGRAEGRQFDVDVVLLRR
jgi:hypothetical protein